MAGKQTAIETLNALQALTSADEIADFFSRKGVSGYKSVAGDCPVANYIKENPGVKTVLVDASSVKVGSCTDINLHAYPAVSDFVRRFDAGAYPGLVKDRHYGA